MLREHYGISALEAQHELPEWERAMLLSHILAKAGVHDGEADDGEAPVADPFATLPDWARSASS